MKVCYKRLILVLKFCSFLRKLYPLLLFGVLSSQICFPQLTIRGKILEKESRESIAGATVFIKEENKGGHTNQNGDFELRNILKKPFSLKISMIGFREEILNITEIPVDTLIVLPDIYLEPV
jgi:hypothetical protein